MKSERQKKKEEKKRKSQYSDLMWRKINTSNITVPTMVCQHFMSRRKSSQHPSSVSPVLTINAAHSEPHQDSDECSSHLRFPNMSRQSRRESSWPHATCLAIMSVNWQTPVRIFARLGPIFLFLLGTYGPCRQVSPGFTTPKLRDDFTTNPLRIAFKVDK